MNIIKAMPIAASIMLALLVVFFFRQSVRGLSTVIGAVMALGALSFFGWFIIDFTH